MKEKIVGGTNIALKIPKSQFADVIKFYKDLGFDLKEQSGFATPSFSCTFGSNTLWIDCVDHIGKADIWLELVADHIPNALERVRQSGGMQRDEIESLPDDMHAHWVCDPAGNTLLLKKKP